MVRRKVVVVVKGVLGCPEEMLRILLLQELGFDRYPQRKDRTADLVHEVSHITQP